MAKKWTELSPGSRRLVVAAGAVDGTLRIAALSDLVRRPASEIRGPKWQWAAALGLVNSMGAVPIAYFLYGRRTVS